MVLVVVVEVGMWWEKVVALVSTGWGRPSRMVYVDFELSFLIAGVDVVVVVRMDAPAPFVARTGLEADSIEIGTNVSS